MIMAGSVCFPRLTRITFDYCAAEAKFTEGGLENGIGQGGGNRVSPLISQTNTRNAQGDYVGSVDLNLTASYLNWNNRYQYRLGFHNVYFIKNLTLYCNGVAAEYQYSNFASDYMMADKLGSWGGINLDPNNRVSNFLASSSSYPKTTRYYS